MKKWGVAVAVLAFAALAFAQQNIFHDPGNDPWWRPLSPAGSSYGVTYGKTRPTSPAPGEIFVDMDGSPTSGPLVEIYDSVNSTWTGIGTSTASGSGTANTVVKFDSSGDLADSSTTDDGTTVTTTATTINLGATTVDLTTANFAFTANTVQADNDWNVNADNMTWTTVSSITQLYLDAGTANASLFDYTVTSPLTAAAETTNLMDLSITNDTNDHTGGTINGLNISGITADAQATENALNIGDGWDIDLNLAGDAIIDFETSLVIRDDAPQNMLSLTPATTTDMFTFAHPTFAANIGEAFVKFTSTASVMSSNTWTALELAITNVDHSGGGINGILVAGITGDAQGTEVALNIGSGWDYAIAIPDSLDISLGDANDALIQFNTSALLLDVTAGTSDDVRVLLDANTGAFFEAAAEAAGNRFRFIPINTASSGATLGDFSVSAVNAIDGSDTINVLQIDWNETEFATGTGNVLNGVNVAAITADTDASQNGINIGTGWDVAVQANGPINGAGVYDDFTDFAVAQDDGTAETVADNTQNYIYTGAPGVPGGRYESRVEQLASQNLHAHGGNGGLLFVPDATANDGIDVAFSPEEVTGPFNFGENTGVLYYEASITIADISTLDGDFWTGFRIAAAWGDPPSETGFNTYVMFTLSDNAGDLDIECDLNAGGAANDDTGVTWADAETHILRLEVDATGLLTAAYVDGTSITITNCGATGNEFESGDKILPFFTFTVGAEGLDPGIEINYLSYGEVQS